MAIDYRRAMTVGGSEHFPDPFHDVASLAMPDQWKNVLQWCFVPGTLVELGDFSQVPIEEIRQGTTVLSREGGLHPVVARSGRRYVGELMRVEFAGLGKSLPWEVTPNHKVRRISGGSKRANENGKRLHRRNEEEIEVGQLQPGDFVATPLPRLTETAIPRFSGWVLGMYLAEGCPVRNGVGAHGIRFTCGADDERTGVLARLCEELQAQTGQEVSPYTPPSRPDVRLVTLFDLELTDWLVSHGGRYSKEKKLSAQTLTYGPNFVRALVAGFCDGDGWTNRGKRQGRRILQGLSGCTASLELGWQLMRLAAAADVRIAGAKRVRTSGLGKGPTTSIQLAVTLADLDRLVGYSTKLQFAISCDEYVPAKQNNCGVVIRDGYLWRKVKKVSRRPYDGPVHNIEVETDHSYIAGGVCVSNCEYIFSANGTYRQAMERVNSYFMTEIVVDSDDEEEKEKWEDFDDRVLHLKQVTQDLLRDRSCYGNSFASFLVPFKRTLRCPRCNTIYNLREVYENSIFKFEFKNYEFCATCPSCKTGSGYSGPWAVKDEIADLKTKLSIKRWSPHEIELLHDPYTDQCAYLWRIPEDYKRQVRLGDIFHLERVTMPVLEAIKKNHLFRFHDDVIFHMKEPTLAGIANRGWGIPRTLTNFRQIYYVQVLKRYNEAIALDYIIPFRLITPAEGAGADQTRDMLMTLDAGDFMSSVRRMLRDRRRNPAGWHTLPFPVNYQALGGDASNLAPRDLLDQGQETLLNDAGTPVELWKGTLQLQTAPVSLRLFQATWGHLVSDANEFIRWAHNKAADILRWDEVEAYLKQVTHADDLDKQMMALQMFVAQQLSGQSGLGALGYDWKGEQRRMAEEARFTADLQAETQKNMDEAGMGEAMAAGQMGPAGAAPAGGAAPAQGAPAPGGVDPATGQPATPMPVSTYLQQQKPGQGVDPEQMVADAQAIAQELLGLPEGVKDSELRKLKNHNSVLHSVVRDQLDSIRRDAKNQGGAAVMQQTFGAAA